MQSPTGRKRASPCGSASSRSSSHTHTVPRPSATTPSMARVGTPCSGPMRVQLVPSKRNKPVGLPAQTVPPEPSAMKRMRAAATASSSGTRHTWPPRIRTRPRGKKAAQRSPLDIATRRPTAAEGKSSGGFGRKRSKRTPSKAVSPFGPPIQSRPSGVWAIAQVSIGTPSAAVQAW